MFKTINLLRLVLIIVQIKKNSIVSARKILNSRAKFSTRLTYWSADGPRLRVITQYQGSRVRRRSPPLSRRAPHRPTPPAAAAAAAAAATAAAASRGPIALHRVSHPGRGGIRGGGVTHRSAAAGSEQVCYAFA
jgi:hypothetical protein